MVSNADKWIRIFDIPDISKHRKGFTIYKVISMLYPESCPDAITKLTVWKRFNDFKKLHRDIKVLHKKLGIRDKVPNLPNASFFKRFDDEVVQERRQCILNFLEYVAVHHQLFTSTAFVKFFESSHTPNDQLNSNISAIRADLNLPEEPEFLAANSDDDPTISDTDSVTTINSLSLSVQTNDTLPDLMSQSYTSLHKSKLSLNASNAPSHHSRNSDSVSVSTTTDSIVLLDGQIYPTPPNTPGCTESYEQYIVDASIHVNIAMELERDKKYEEAFTAYKTAVDILLRYGKEDRNYDRRQMVRYKIEKYLIKAEKIYNMHLAAEVRNLKEISEVQENEGEERIVQRPISDLYKYKVIKVIASGMLVLHSELQQLFYIKVIHKTMKYFSANLILPENVPYMVKLYNYYNCENALFLVLEYCSGMKLWDYVRQRSENPDDVFYHSGDEILRHVQEMDLSDAESERSYSDLINEYTSCKNNPKGDDVLSLSDDSYEKVDAEELHHPNLMDAPLTSGLNVEDLLTKSRRLVAGVDGELGREEGGGDAQSNFRNKTASGGQRKFSEMSSFDEVDVTQNWFVPTKDVVRWSAQLLLALEKLHTLGIVCRDLQSENLLISEDGDLLLTYMCNVNELCDIFTDGKSFHLAPEIYSFQPVTEAADWWCFGAILYEFLVGMPLSSIHPDGLTIYSTLKIPKYVSPEGRSLLKQLLAIDPQDRLGFGVNGVQNLKSHPFFHSVPWSDLLAKYDF